MSAGRVVCERNGAVASVTFERPAARNALTWEMYEELSQIIDALEGDKDLRVVTFRGSGGKAFVAGTDIRQFVEFESAEDGVRYERFIDDLIDRLEGLPLATVAIIEGHAVGGGLAIAAACDLRVCTPDAHFGLPIARTVGNCLSMKNYARLVALLGVARTKTMIFMAESLSAAEAAASGFVMQVVQPEQLDAAVDAVATRLAQHAPITLRGTKQALNNIVARMVPENDDLIRQAYGSRDFHEGVAAFLEKRPPVWRGH